jgi:uncharacterized protein
VWSTLKVLFAFAAIQAVELPPAPRGYGTTTAEVVVDAARVLSPESVARINRLAFDVHAKSGGELAVVTLPDIGDGDPGTVALQIGRSWGVGANSAVGERARNAGVVILLVPRETSRTGRGRLAISTGQGAEGFITDAEAGDIRREATALLQAQAARAGALDYNVALRLMTQRIAEKYAQEFGFTLDTGLVAALPPLAQAPEPGARGRRGGINPLVVVVIVIILVSLFSRGGGGGGGRRRRGGIYPVIIPPFGGGGFGGGGGWGRRRGRLRRLRRRRRVQRRGLERRLLMRRRAAGRDGWWSRGGRTLVHDFPGAGQVASTTRMGLDELVARLTDAFGAELRAVVLYGLGGGGRADRRALRLQRARARRGALDGPATGGRADDAGVDQGGQPGAAHPHRARVARVGGYLSHGVRRHPRAAPRAARRGAMDGITVHAADLRLQVEQQAMGKGAAAPAGHDGRRE